MTMVLALPGRSMACVLAAGLLSTSAAWAANLGFEEGPPGPSAPGWTLEAADSAAVTTGDDGSDFSVYADFGIQVPPLLGSQSLRLGTPKQVNESQSRGPNTATSDPFEMHGTELRVAFRLFSLEHRGDDRLIFEVLDQWGNPLNDTTFSFTPRSSGSTALENMASLCDSGPSCELVIDIGKRDKRPADSGVYELTIALPAAAADAPVRLRYTVLGGNNEAHGSWAYFDSVNRPPQAVMGLNPGGDAENPALEGDFVVADCLDTVDPDGDAVSCSWTASGGGLDGEKTADGSVAVFWFPDNTPAASIELTATDAEGRSETLTRTVHLRNAQPVVNAVNVEIVAGSTGTTICRFADAGLGQFGPDGVVEGQEERHELVGTSTAVRSGEEWSPSFSSGFFEYEVDANGTCTIRDKDGAYGSDSFLVNPILPETLAFRLGDDDRLDGAGGNESFDTAHPLEVDWKYLGMIADPQDIDVFRIERNGAALPAGSEVVLSLEGLPADYDLLVFSNGGSTQASPFFNAPFFNAPFFNAPFFNAPFFNAPFFNAQFDSVPFFNAPFFNAPFFNAPFFNAPIKKSPFFNAANPAEPFNRAFSELPLSQVGLAAPDGSNVSNSDISVAEIGSLSLRTLQAVQGISLKALSAEPGTASEKVLVEVSPGETELYAVVVGHQLAFSASQPYQLTVEASTPPNQAELLAGTGFCDGERADPSSAGGELKFAATWGDPGDQPATSGGVLILTQISRLEVEQADAAATAVGAGRFDSQAAYWADFWAKLDEYAATVNGVVVSVAGNLFEPTDRNPCSVATRNDLAKTIRDTYVMRPGDGDVSPEWRNPNLESVVIVGGQNVIPVHAVPDETVVGNERDFTTDLWVRPGTPLAVATAEGYNLTDAAYVDLQPTPFRGRALYLEDLPVARLEETPEAIKANLDAYLYGRDNQGRLAMGYDFFCDGTAEAAELLGVTPINGPPCDPFSSPWDAQTLRSQWLGGGPEICLAPDAPAPLELAVVNAHMTTYAALSAAGFESGIMDPPRAPGFGDTVGAEEAQQCLAGTTTLTIGCHSGLNIPDAWAVPLELGLPFDPRRDWVEALGNLVAPRGYGLGDNTVSNRGTEGLITLLLEELAGGKNLGQALVTAKRRYVMGLRELDVHDEDSLINLALFGPPQLTFNLPGDPSSLTASTSTVIGSYFADLDVKLVEGNGDGTESYLLGSANAAASFELLEFQDPTRGSWFEISPGDAQATYGRPLLPVTLPVEDRLVADGDTRIHGMALVSRDAAVSPCPIDGTDRACTIAARYVDLEDADGDGLFDFNPVFPLPQHDWVVYEDDLDVVNLDEPQTCVDALAPTQLGVASTLDNGQEVRQSLVIGAAQFRCEEAAQNAAVRGQTVGQHRLFQEVQLAALRPVGGDAHERLQRDGDFDPPQVLVQDLSANAGDCSVTATVEATDALTGGSGISEIIALVYWDEADTQTGTGVVESYSVQPQAALTAEPFEHTFVLENARNKRLAFQYIDGAGNMTQKSLKGSLFLALDVNIATTLLSGSGSGSISVLVGDYCDLVSPTISVRIDSGDTLVFTPDDPPPGVTVSVQPSGDPEAPCDRVLVLDGLDLSAVADTGTATLTVEIRAQGAMGSDTATLMICADPDEPDVVDEADILACGFAVADDEVIIDMFIAGYVTSDVQYRVLLPDFSAQFKYFDLGKTSSPGGTQLKVDVINSSQSGSQLQFRIRNLGNIGWDGSSPIRFQEVTQSGQPGKPGQGFPDETAVFTGTP